MHAPSATLTPSTSPKHLNGRVWTAVGRASATIAVYLAGYRDAGAAAATYRELSRLSDAELARRRMNRADVHRYVFEELVRPPATGGPIDERTWD